jgi:integrase
LSTNVQKRGDIYYFDRVSGGRRIRASLGVHNPQAARTLVRQIEAARAEGPKAEEWATLRIVLPPASFLKVSSGFHLKESPKIQEFSRRFYERLDRRVRLGELAGGSRRLYEKAAQTFFSRLTDLGVQLLDECTPEVVEEYVIWRKDSLAAKGGSASSLRTETSALSAIFSFAQEEGLIQVSPLKSKITLDTEARGAEPFTQEEMERLGAATDESNKLPFLLLKNTGLRGGDASELTWAAYDPLAPSIRCLTKKRKKTVVIPLTKDFNEYLSLAYIRREPRPQSTDKILLGMARPKLYTMMTELGKKAGVPGANPHRFRDTLAVTILRKGGTIYDVARVLGDAVATVDKFYTPFVSDLQERVREILEKSS